MTPEQRTQLENEVSIGNRAQNAYESFDKNFISNKRTMLIDKIIVASNSDIDLIVKLKLTIQLVQQLDEEYMSIINTGKMASKMLADATK